MTAKEASVLYNEKYGRCLAIGGDRVLPGEEYIEINKNPAFIAGAEWQKEQFEEEERKHIIIYNDALNKYGIRNQKEMVYEEIGELLNALAKSNRNRVAAKDIITELADVHIMVEQMALFYGWDEFKAEKDRKLERLQERLLKNKHKENQQ